MPTLTFDNSNNDYTVDTADSYDLAFLKGNDKLWITADNSFVQTDMGDDDDQIWASGQNTEIHADLGAGNDLFWINAGTYAEVYGGDGNDEFDIYGSNVWAYGGTGDDTFVISAVGQQTFVYGDAGQDVFYLGMGDNVFIDGGADNDTFYGPPGSMTGSVYGGSGNDLFLEFEDTGSGLTLFGGLGDDTYIVSGWNGPLISEAPGAGTDEVVLMGPAIYSMGQNIENLSNDGNNPDLNPFSITANSLDNIITLTAPGRMIIWSGAGDDYVITGSNNDTIFGEGGNDTLFGNDGVDLLIGGHGRDVMSGGAGSDTFRFDAIGDSPTPLLLGPTDMITDYEANKDVIDLHNIDANSQVAGNQAFTLVAASTGAAGQLWVTSIGNGDYKIFADVNGGGADLVITAHMIGGNAGDFVFGF